MDVPVLPQVETQPLTFELVPDADAGPTNMKGLVQSANDATVTIRENFIRILLS